MLLQKHTRKAFLNPHKLHACVSFPKSGQWLSESRAACFLSTTLWASAYLRSVCVCILKLVKTNIISREEGGRLNQGPGSWYSHGQSSPLHMGKNGTIWRFFPCFGGRCLQDFGHTQTHRICPTFSCAFPASIQEHCPPKCLFFMANAKLPNRPRFALLQLPPWDSGNTTTPPPLGRQEYHDPPPPATAGIP